MRSHQRRSWSAAPVSCCLSATGIRLLGHRSPAEELGLPHSRLTGHRPDLNGVVMLCMSKTRPGRTPPLPRGRWCAPGRRLLSGRHPPLSNGQSLRPRWCFPSAGDTLTRHQRRFTQFVHHPAGLLLACGPRMERRPLGLLLEASHPAVTRDARRGGDRPSRTGPGTTPSTSAEPPTVPPTCTHAPSCRT